MLRYRFYPRPSGVPRGAGIVYGDYRLVVAMGIVLGMLAYAWYNYLYFQHGLLAQR